MSVENTELDCDINILELLDEYTRSVLRYAYGDASMQGVYEDKRMVFDKLIAYYKNTKK